MTSPPPFPKKRAIDFRTPRLEAFDSSWKIKELASGLTLLHVPSPHDEHFYIGAVIRAGTRVEVEANNGVAHFLEHMMFRGCKRYPDFTKMAEAFEWLGGEWNAATSHEHTEYWYSGIRATADEIVDLFAEFLENPLFNDFEVERNVIVRELEGETNDFGNSTDLDHHAATLLWPKSPLALSILGTKETIAAMNLDKLRAYRDRHYTPRNTAICIVGGDPSWDALKLLETHFARYRAGLPAPKPSIYAPIKAASEPSVKWVEHSDNEYEVKLCFACAGEWSDESPLIELIARILSDGFCSRLGLRLREQLGLVYDVTAMTALYHDLGSLEINASCEKDQLDVFLAELFKLLKTFRDAGPTNDELDRARIRALVDLELSPTRPELIGPRLAWAHLNGKKISLAQERARLEGADHASVTHAARYLLKPQRAALVALGPAGKDVEKRLKKALVDGLA